MSVQDLKNALEKKAATENEGSLQVNEGTTSGPNDVYPTPEASKEREGTTNALWGEAPTKPEHSTAILEAHHEGRDKQLERLLDGVPQASAVDKATIAQNFNAAPRAEAHSVLLNPKGNKTAEAKTLTRQVIDLVGRR
jgi:hypothetical protein